MGGGMSRRTPSPNKIPYVPAKERHTQAMLKFLSDWDNPFPNRAGLAKVCGILETTLYDHFSPDELNQILSDGLDLRKKHSYAQRSEIYDVMHASALKGSVQAQDKFLDRTEGKVTEKIEHKLDKVATSLILAALPPEYAEKVKEALLSIEMRDKE